MNSKKLYRGIIIGLLVCFIGGVSLLGVMRWRIQSSLDRQCATAQSAKLYPGDNIAALLEYVQSESHTLKERNLAVWALGQARDGRALEVLEKYYTGEKCDQDRKLCQKELKKAIILCKSGSHNLLNIQISSN